MVIIRKRSRCVDRHTPQTCSLVVSRSWLGVADFIRFFVAVRWKQALPLIRKTVSSTEVTQFSFTGEEVWHMDTKLQYLVQMCVGVQMCYSLSVGVCQSNKQNRLRPSALLMGERGASRCFDSNL